MIVDDDVAEVRHALRLVAEDMAVPADLAARARHGGRRRVRRRRLIAASAGCVLAAAVAAGGVSVTQRPSPSPADWQTIGDRLMSQPTRGDLAGDEAYLGRVVATYLDTREQTPLSGLGVTEHPIGQPHVAWAGRTPEGPAAAVVQRTKLPDRVRAAEEPGPGRSLGGETATLIKFIGTGPDGSPETVGTDFFGPDGYPGDNSVAFLVGQDRSVLVVLDPGTSVEYSLERTYTSTAIFRADWRPVRFTDGAAVLTVAPQRGRYSLAIREREGGDHFGIGNLTDPTEWGNDRGLDWRTPPTEELPAAQPARFPVGGADPALADCWYECAAAVEAYGRLLGWGDPRGGEPQTLVGTGRDWLAYGWTSGGKRLVAADLRLGADPLRSVVVIETDDQSPSTVYGPPIDRNAPLPVMVELPGRAGWLVARKGAQLEYRIDDRRWVAAGANAALLPAEATAVRVDGVEVVVLTL